jgi:hypothetical protein
MNQIISYIIFKLEHCSFQAEGREGQGSTVVKSLILQQVAAA